MNIVGCLPVIGYWGGYAAGTVGYVAVYYPGTNCCFLVEGATEPPKDENVVVPVNYKVTVAPAEGVVSVGGAAAVGGEGMGCSKFGNVEGSHSSPGVIVDYGPGKVAPDQLKSAVDCARIRSVGGYSVGVRFSGLGADRCQFSGYAGNYYGNYEGVIVVWFMGETDSSPTPEYSEVVNVRFDVGVYSPGT